MKTLRALAALPLLLAIVGVAEAQPRAERPTWQVGDRWVRSDGVWDLVRIENDHRRVARESLARKGIDVEQATGASGHAGGDPGRAGCAAGCALVPDPPAGVNRRYC